MKQLVSLLLAVLLVCSFTACGGEETVEYTDSYLYTTVNGVLYRISTVSASVAPVCPDPLCEHMNESCPFYGVEHIDMEGQYIYYLKGFADWGYSTSLCRYDLKNGKYEELYTPEEGTLTDVYASSEYVYFNLVLTDENLNYKYYVWRYDVGNEKAECLFDEGFDDFQNCLFIEDERAYWSGDGFYSTDLEYKDRCDNDRKYSPNLTMDKYAFECENSKIMGFEGYQQMCLRITRVDLESGERVVVSEEMASYPLFYGGKLIYSKLDELRYIGKTQDGETGQWRDCYDKYGGKLYICDSDGSNERLLCDFSDSKYTVGVTSGILGGKNGVGDWIALRLFTYVSVDEGDPEKVRRGENAYLLINIVTGETKVAEVETRS